MGKKINLVMFLQVIMGLFLWVD